jgi:hypothetical protein
MRKLSRSILAATAAALPLTSVAVVSAAPAGATVQMPLAGVLRACDASHLDNVFARQYGVAFAVLTTPGSNTVAANVTIATGQPNTYYNARIIQVPRPSNNCAPGDPGVIAGGFETDATGAGGVNLAGPIKSGATGAWVVLDRPAPNTLTPAEFYTSDFIAAI